MILMSGDTLHLRCFVLCTIIHPILGPFPGGPLLFQLCKDTLLALQLKRSALTVSFHACDVVHPSVCWFLVYMLWMG